MTGQYFSHLRLTFPISHARERDTNPLNNMKIPSAEKINEQPSMQGVAAVAGGLGGGDDVIEAGADKGKTVAQLQDEVFNPNVSDLEYFLSRCRHHGIKPPNNSGRTAGQNDSTTNLRPTACP